MAGMLLALILSLPASVITVGPHGADFTTIADALVAAQPGDVLLIASGDYGPFVTSKDVKLIGPAGGPRPRVSGTSEIYSAPHFVVAGLEFDALEVGAVHGVLDDCVIGSWSGAGSDPTLRILDSPLLVVSRCSIQGLDGMGGLGVEVIGTVDFIANDIHGGRGEGDITGPRYPGGAGVSIGYGSDVRFADCTVIGGEGGYGSPFSGDGKAGDGVVMEDACNVLVRGIAANLFLGGPWLPGWGDPGAGIVVEDGWLVYSGVTLDTVEIVAPDLVAQAPVPEPFIRFDGTPPLDDAQLSVHGPAGALALVLVSTTEQFKPFASLELPLWLPVGTSAIVPLVTSGQETPIVLSGHAPPGLLPTGGVLLAQAAFLDVPSTLEPGKSVVTNTAQLVPRF